MRQHPSGDYHGRGPQERPDQSRRREDQRRGGREPDPLASRRCRTSPASPCPMPIWASGCAPVSSCAPGKTLTFEELVDYPPDQGDREIQTARAAGDHGRFPAVEFRQGVEERSWSRWSRPRCKRNRARSTQAMRKIDLHCYPNTEPWITCQGPYVEALAKYWNRQWTWKQEDEVVKEFETAGVEAVLVALDLETTTNTPPCTQRICDGDAEAASRSHHPVLGRGRSVQGRDRNPARRRRRSSSWNARLPLPSDHGAFRGQRPAVLSAVRDH